MPPVLSTWCHLFGQVLAVSQTMKADEHPLYLLFLIPITVTVCAIAGILTFTALRRLKVQHARAEELAGNLHQIREENQRRLVFLNAISHDLRTPLNGIALQTHVIEHALDSKDPAVLAAAVAEIRNASSLAAEVLDALLQYAHTDIDETVLASVDLTTLLTQTADPFRAAAEEKGLAFTLSVPADLKIATDAVKLQRLFANLVDNAVKFTTLGSITIRAAPDASADGHPSLLIEVEDTGVGIPTEALPRLFEEFYQANNPSRDARLGLGLGLVIAKRLAHQLGGSLTCESTIGKGSTFLIRLPVRRT
jgi:signal transduction histidine kinase